MKRSIQLVALLLTVFMGSCTGGKDKAAAEHVDAKPIVKLADVKATVGTYESTYGWVDVGDSES